MILEAKIIKRLFGLAAPWLVGVLFLGQYGIVVAQSNSESPVKRETIESLSVNFDLEQTLEILGGCAERVD